MTLPSVARYWKPSVLRMKKLSFELSAVRPVVAGERLPGQLVGELDRRATSHLLMTLLMKSLVLRQMPVAVNRSLLVSCVSNETLNSSVRGCLISELMP